MGERMFLLIQDMFFKKNGIRNILLILLVVFLPVVIFSWDKLDYLKLLEVVNGDLFNVSGILAGFVFTGLGILSTSNSKMVIALKETGNFNKIKNFYINSISAFIGVMLLYLIRPVIVPDIEIINNNILINKFAIIYLLIIIFIFLFAGVLFIFSLYILNNEFEQ